MKILHLRVFTQKTVYKCRSTCVKYHTDSLTPHIWELAPTPRMHRAHACIGPLLHRVSKTYMIWTPPYPGWRAYGSGGRWWSFPLEILKKPLLCSATDKHFISSVVQQTWSHTHTHRNNKALSIILISRHSTDLKSWQSDKGWPRFFVPVWHCPDCAQSICSATLSPLAPFLNIIIVSSVLYTGLLSPVFVYLVRKPGMPLDKQLPWESARDHIPVTSWLLG